MDSDVNRAVAEDKMPDDTSDSSEIKDTDIVFDCPYCSKSLAIDYRGAGLTIPCSDCGRYVQVPVPDGMEMGDIDSTQEEQVMRIRNLRKALTTAEAKIRDLEEKVADLSAKREALQKIQSENMYRFGAVVEKVGVIQKALKDIFESLNKISANMNGTR